MAQKFYCYICKDTIYTRREIKKHALRHFVRNSVLHPDGERCPYCGMKTKRFLEHFVYYHLYYRKNAIFRRDLAILCKESGDTKILDDRELNLNKVDKSEVRRLLKKL